MTFHVSEYLESHREEIGYLEGSVEIRSSTKGADKEAVRFRIGEQEMYLVRYFGLESGRFNAFMSPDGMPTIPQDVRPIWIDSQRRVVIFHWRNGDKLYAFNERTPGVEIQDETWKAIGYLLASVHVNHYSGFSYVEMEPANFKSMGARYTFGPPQNFRDFVLYSFADTVTKNLQIAVMRSMLSESTAFLIQRECEDIGALITSQDGMWENPESFSVLHGDVNPENIIVGPDDSINLIDWDTWYIGDPSADLALLFEQMCQAGITAHSLVWKGYSDHESVNSSDTIDRLRQRVLLYEKMILVRYAALVANGLCSDDPYVVNQELFENACYRLFCGKENKLWT